MYVPSRWVSVTMLLFKCESVEMTNYIIINTFAVILAMNAPASPGRVAGVYASHLLQTLQLSTRSIYRTQ